MNREQRRKKFRIRPKMYAKKHLQRQLENAPNLNKFDAAGTILKWISYLRNKYNRPGYTVIAHSNVI